MEMKHLVYLSVILFLAVGLEAAPVRKTVKSSVNQKIIEKPSINADPVMTSPGDLDPKNHSVEQNLLETNKTMTEKNVNQTKPAIGVIPSDPDESDDEHDDDHDDDHDGDHDDNHDDDYEDDHDDDDFESAEILTKMNKNLFDRVIELAEKHPVRLSLQLNLNYKPTHNVSPVYVTGDTFVSSGMVPPFPVDDMSENQEEDKK